MSKKGKKKKPVEEAPAEEAPAEEIAPEAPAEEVSNRGGRSHEPRGSRKPNPHRSGRGLRGK